MPVRLQISLSAFPSNANNQRATQKRQRYRNRQLRFVYSDPYLSDVFRDNSASSRSIKNLLADRTPSGVVDSLPSIILVRVSNDYLCDRISDSNHVEEKRKGRRRSETVRVSKFAHTYISRILSGHYIGSLVADENLMKQFNDDTVTDGLD